jgi:hypothetical protein
MDIDLFKLVALVSGILAILDKVYTYGKSAYQSLKKIHQKWSRPSLKQANDLILGSYAKTVSIRPFNDVDISVYASCPRRYYYQRFFS